MVSSVGLRTGARAFFCTLVQLSAILIRWEESPSEKSQEKKMTPEDFTLIKVLGKGNYGKVSISSFIHTYTHIIYIYI